MFCRRYVAKENYNDGFRSAYYIFPKNWLTRRRHWITLCP